MDKERPLCRAQLQRNGGEWSLGSHLVREIEREREMPAGLRVKDVERQNQRDELRFEAWKNTTPPTEKYSPSPNCRACFLF